MEVNYVGIREPFKDILKDIEPLHSDHSTQILDLGGAIEYDFDNYLKRVDPKLETIIVSNRRFDLNDELGSIESELMKEISHSILYRTSPLDINIDLYRGWAAATGILLTAFSPEGVNWVNTQDIAKACSISREEIRLRSGKAFEITGPETISMNKLKAILETDLEMEIDLQCRSKDEVIKILLQNKIPMHVLEWLVNFQEQSSDTRLEPKTNILEKIIETAPSTAQLNKNKNNNIA